MKSQNESKLFAFQLAKQVEQEKPQQQWKMRDGIANASECSGDDLRYDSWYWGRDQGDWC